MKWVLSLRRYHLRDGIRYEAEYRTSKMVEPLPNLISYKEIVEWMKNHHNIFIIPANKLLWERRRLPAGSMGRYAEYAFIDATRPNPHGCVVTMSEVENGWQPDWND